MKNNLSKFIFACLVALLFSGNAFSYGTKIDGLYYNLDSMTKTAEVTFSTMSTPSPFAGNYRDLTVASIPSTIDYKGTTYSVTKIGKRAFYYSGGLTSVTIPNSVTSIEEEAFSGCSGLTNMTIPDSVTELGKRTFSNCSRLASVTIGNSISTVEYETFSGCSGLSSVTIGKSVTSIDERAFYGCNGLSKVYTYDLETWCKIKFSSIISNPLSFAHHLYLNGQEIKNLVIPNSITSIRDYTFYGCSGLTSVTLGNSVTSIGYSAFYGCSGLTSVTIPNSVTSIENDAFTGCSGIKEVIMEDGETQLALGSFYGSETFYSCPVEKVYLGRDLFYHKPPFSGKDRIKTVIIGNKVPEIGFSMFSNQSSLSEITIPSSVTYIREDAFYGCSGLKTIAFYSDQLLKLGSRAFSGCNEIESIYCNTTKPPVANNFDVFSDDTYANAKLYVPSTDVSLYYSMVPWSKFFNITGTDDFPTPDELGVESIFSPEERVDVYNLNGTLLYKNVDPSQLNNIAPGLYIIGGKKVIIK